ncbi:hypothetical protein ACULTK_003774 [Yersinia enterocolitica]|uniref:hypothetical protein n=1 Tax=Yersinia enterocolitica TaxID=630 RepID=UPI0005E1C028|nr:hypothetical protein [Yersinia enterocolitica]EKN3693639.1 hypothetical protein [Yersinia enterocolitica]EKN4883157.1 hypothetical protein [Yersinia enterocolitica]EKN6093288.1 hypothetical protein [Yersinia enterocolitica]EKN6127504.1 hypothetical protein [Yersinia enterocolitica]EKN6288560.1 hypothetical protein [Yersinia enterocolitica]
MPKYKVNYQFKGVDGECTLDSESVNLNEWSAEVYNFVSEVCGYKDERGHSLSLTSEVSPANVGLIEDRYKIVIKEVNPL